MKRIIRPNKMGHGIRSPGHGSWVAIKERDDAEHDRVIARTEAAIGILARNPVAHMAAWDGLEQNPQSDLLDAELEANRILAEEWHDKQELGEADELPYLILDGIMQRYGLEVLEYSVKPLGSGDYEQAYDNFAAILSDAKVQDVDRVACLEVFNNSPAIQKAFIIDFSDFLDTPIASNIHQLSDQIISRRRTNRPRRGDPVHAEHGIGDDELPDYEDGFHTITPYVHVDQRKHG